MDFELQIWGGGFYFVSKILLAQAEGSKNKWWAISGWTIYLLGIPAWFIVLKENRNWIALSIELGGAPGMILGIYVVQKNIEKIPVRLSLWMKYFTWVLIAVGSVFSLYDFGGLNSISQILEIGVTIGYLRGINLLAEKDSRGWYYFLIMNGSMALLTFIQERYFMMFFQMASMFFAVRGLRRSKKA